MGPSMKHLRYIGREEMPSVREVRRAVFWVDFHTHDGARVRKPKRSGAVLHDIFTFLFYAALTLGGLVLFVIGWTLTYLAWTLGRVWYARRKLFGAYHTAHPNEPIEKGMPRRW